MSLNKFPLVSFIIPFYNHNHFIKQTLDSLLQDTYPNKEIIIINDGSSNPDDSNITKWINEHNESIDINYIKRENRGITKTLNELIELSKGKYIVSCASDDYLINNTITKRVEILENNSNKLFLVSDNIVVNDDNKKLFNSNLFEYRGANLEDYLNDNRLKHTIISKWSFAGACFMANRKVYDIVGKYDESITVEDWDLFLRIVSKDLMLFNNDKVSAYRLHDSNTINNPKVSLGMYKSQVYVAKKSLNLFAFPYNIYLYRRYLKYKIKLQKIEEKFPYNLFLYKKYKSLKDKK